MISLIFVNFVKKKKRKKEKRKEEHSHLISHNFLGTL